MKLVPMALTCTPLPATSSATLRTSMLARARGLDLVDQPRGGIADDEIGLPLRQQTGKLGADVAGGVADDGDPSAHDTRSSRAMNIGPYSHTSWSPSSRRVTTTSGIPTGRS